MSLDMDEDQAMTEHGGLVHLVVRDMRRRYSWFRLVPVMDLQQAGNIGLLCAVRNYDRDRGYAFSSYACVSIRRWIYRQYNQRYFRDPLTQAWPFEDVPDHRDDAASVDDADQAANQADRIQQALAWLASLRNTGRQSDRCQNFNARLARLVRARFWDDAMLKDIGRAEGTTRERARQLLEDAFELLRWAPPLARERDAAGGPAAPPPHLDVKLRLAGPELPASVDAITPGQLQPVDRRAIANLGLAIRVLREQQEITQATLARRAGLSQAHISLLEGTRRVPHHKTIARVAAGLGTSVADLFALVASLEAS